MSTTTHAARLNWPLMKNNIAHEDLDAVSRLLSRDDPVLTRRAGDFITLWWALWAEQQLDGVCGGAKTRCYPNSSTHGNRRARDQTGAG